MKRLLALVLVVCGAARALASPRGMPLITVYPAEVHKAGPQNFRIAQDSRGVLYFGNLAGLLTWDGAWWRLLMLPGDQAPLSVATNAKGAVVIGMVDDLGQIVDDKFRSLGAGDFGEVRSICTIGDAFLFVAEKQLFLWDGKSMRRAPNASADRACFADSGGTLLYGRNGVHRFDAASMRVDPLAFEGKRIDVVLRAADGRLIVAIRDEGLVTIDGAPYAKIEGIVTSGTRLHDGRLVIATRQNGIGIFARDGHLDEWINDKSGLPDAVLAATFTDREGDLWLGMEGPIVRIDVATPVSLFDARRGLKGSVSDVVEFDGRMWASTSHGFFFFDSDGVAQLVPAISGSAWHLLPFDDQLLISTTKGVFRIRKGTTTPEQILATDVEVYDMDRSTVDRSRVWLAVRSGVRSIRWDGAKWIVERPVVTSPEYITTIVDQNGVLFCGTVFEGIVRIEAPLSDKPRMTNFGSGEMNVYAAAGRVLFVSAHGEIVAPDAKGNLVPDPQFGAIRAPRGFFVIAEDARGNLWLNSTPPRMIAKESDGHYASDGQPLVSVTAADIQSLRTFPDGTVWFGSDKGLFRYEPSAEAKIAPQPPPVIRRAIADKRRMRIEFAPVSYRPGVTYQYRLDPSDSGWSSWTEQPFIDYTNLDPAKYVFRLRSRGPDAAPSVEARWSFTVFPPWYRTTWAWILWIAVGIALLAALVMLRTRALRRQAEELRKRVAEQTEELLHKNELLEQANARLESLSMLDELTGIANRRFFENALADEWNRALRREEPLSLVLLDLDHFKDLNDRRGHRAGDDALRMIGRHLGDAIRRSGEVVARYGGEEFAALLPGTDTLEAVRVAERLRAGIETLEIGYADGMMWRVTTSCGVATMLPRLGDSMEMLVDRADRALYAAKHAGRNAVRVASEATSGTWLKDAGSV